MKIKPMLGSFAIDGIEYIESSESRALVEHRVPGLAGNYFQDMGSVPNSIVISGTKSGDEARDNFLTGIREIFNKGEPTTFVADINTATDITDVVIEDLEVAEIGGSPDSFRYLIKLRKYVKPPEPPATGLLDAGILGDALSLVEGAMNALDALGSIPNLGDPTGPVRGALDAIQVATDGLDQTVNDLRNLFGETATESPVSGPGAAGGGPSAPTPPAGNLGIGGASTPPTTSVQPTTTITSAPVPSAGRLRIDPTDPRIDGATGTVLQSMLKAPETAEAAGRLVGGVQSGELAGIQGDNSEAAKQLASAHGTEPSQLISPGQDAALALDAASPLNAPPTILLRSEVRSDPARLSAALAEVGRTFDFFQQGQLVPCASAASAIPVPNLVPSSFCRVQAVAPMAKALVLDEETTEPVKEVIKEGPQCQTALDIGFVHFNSDRHVLMPEGPTPEPSGEAPGEGADGLPILARALAHAQQHPQREMLVAGHCDTTGSIQYNLQLSARRANSAFFVLQGHIHKEDWVKSALLDGGHADDWRRILRWVHKQYGLDCEASDPARPDSAKDMKAIKGFQRGYNEQVDELAQSGTNPFAPGFKDKIPTSQMGFVGISTWRAFFDFYQRELMRLLNLPSYDQLRKIQDAVKLVRPPTQGCGEFHSRDLAERASRRERGYREKADPPRPKDRRVEILFFDPGETPPFDCHPTTDVLKCDPLKCLLYKDNSFVQRPLPPLDKQLTTKVALVGVGVMQRGSSDFTAERNFSPLLKEKARFRIRLDDLPVPFEGTLRIVVSRPTDDGFGPVAILEQKVCSLTEKQIDVAVEWVGKTDRDVPRQLSARTTPNLNNNGAPMHLPLREMKKDDNVRHGVYVVERIELAEKDGIVIASDKPQDPGLVVPVICTLFFDMNLFVSSLHHFGIGDGVNFNAPYVDEIRRAILAVARSHYGGMGIRFAITRTRTASVGFMIHIKDTVAFLDPTGAGVIPGGTVTKERGAGFVVSHNIFAWIEESFGSNTSSDRLTIEIGPTGMLNRNVDQNSDDSKVLHEVFGPLGVAKDSKSNPFLLPDAETPKPTKPRTVTAGRVEGEVTDLDAANTSVSVSDGGVFTVTTINPSIVPAQRAADIQRALNAFTNSVGAFAAHELGHALGLVAKADPSKTKIDVPGKGAVLSPLAGGDDGGHNRPPQGTLMDPGETIRLRTIFTPGKRLAFGASDRRYLLDCFPERP